MADRSAKIRLFVHDDLAEGAALRLDLAQANYLFGVMRLGTGAPLLVFNGRDGEFAATVTEAGRKDGALAVGERVREQACGPDLWLLFAPVKKARTDFIVEKAVEMGASRLVPVMTRYTNTERVKLERLRANAVEAAEQCGRLDVPEVAEPVALGALLDGWDPARRLMFCDERSEAGSLAGAPGEAPPPWAVLIGPEGGFSEEERDRLRGLDFAVPVSLGPRILRADTAAVAALTLWQSRLGDWPRGDGS